jgi:hypothetical protein
VTRGGAELTSGEGEIVATFAEIIDIGMDHDGSSDDGVLTRSTRDREGGQCEG